MMSTFESMIFRRECRTTTSLTEWRSTGIPNGVRVLRMKLTKPVPSYVSIKGLISLAAHFWISTCRRCEQRNHPDKTCSAAKAGKTNVNCEMTTCKQTTTNTIVPDPTTTTEADLVSEVDTIDDGFSTVGKRGKTIKRQLSAESKITPQEKKCHINYGTDSEMDEEMLLQIGAEDSAKLKTDNFMKWCELKYMS
uniref:(northern house mosquito) hypothetical protein n=1 Tax=Culex pipiens TaxID=7175 RepID=A0A8D8I4T4_CULPI